MRLGEMFESRDDDALWDKQRRDHEEHAEALRDTGFWGKQAGGCLFLARSTGRFLISHRSQHVEQPGTWGTFGGAIDSGEQPDEAVRREVQEECGYYGQMKLVPLYVFRQGTFSYYNFLAVVSDEFEPELDWETQGYVWTKWGMWPQPLHFGLQGLLSDKESARKMKTLSQARRSR